MQVAKTRKISKIAYLRRETKAQDKFVTSMLVTMALAALFIPVPIYAVLAIITYFADSEMSGDPVGLCLIMSFIYNISMWNTLRWI